MAEIFSYLAPAIAAVCFLSFAIVATRIVIRMFVGEELEPMDIAGRMVSLAEEHEAPRWVDERALPKQCSQCGAPLESHRCDYCGSRN